jgi:hypothetical protein
MMETNIPKDYLPVRGEDDGEEEESDEREEKFYDSEGNELTKE